MKDSSASAQTSPASSTEGVESGSTKRSKPKTDPTDASDGKTPMDTGVDVTTGNKVDPKTGASISTTEGPLWRASDYGHRNDNGGHGQ